MSLSNRAVGAVVRTLLLTDLVDSTRLIERIGDVRGSELLADSDRIARDLLVQFNGTEIDKTDGFLFLFERPIDAVRYALAYHTALAELESRVGASISSRAGIHLGEVVLRRNAPQDVELGAKPVEVDGLAKHTAARVMSLAGTKQTLLTRGAFDLSRRATVGETALDEEIQWLAHGQYRFKGVSEPMEIFEVGRAGFAPLAAPLDSEKAGRALTEADRLMLGWRPAAGLEVPHRSNWVLRDKLGEGGFGEAWLAANGKTGEQRTFKFCMDAERLRALRREVSIFRLMRELLGNRDDIGRILDWQFDESPYFLESEWSEDGNFMEWADRQGGLDQVPLSIRLELIAQLADALAAAHSVGVLHKDLKPASVLIATDPNGVPKVRLTDFGVGAIQDTQLFVDKGITFYSMTDMFLPESDSATGGAHLYLAPELIRGNEATTQTDIFALGVMLYQVVVADFGRALASGWERNISDELLREDISSLVDGSTDRRKDNAIEAADHLRRLDERRNRLESGERTSADGESQMLTGPEPHRGNSAAFGAAPRHQPGAGPEKPVIGGMISHYRIIEKLAEGGMGALYLAEDIRLKRRVALKFLLARALQNATVRQRFIREARAAALLDHPNICPVFEIDEVGDGPDRQTFIAMPYIGGGSLRERLLEEPLPVSEVVDIIIQVGSGLACAHSHGIVHRDIKPANIMLTSEGTPKIVDFGLAMIVEPMDGRELTELTQAGAVSGTLLYMSPEQARGTKVDHRSDIWSLGVLAYEAATGKHPFQAAAPHVFLNSLVNEQPESISALRPEAPQDLDWVVRRAMAKSPDERYQKVETLVAELRAIQTGQTSVSRVRVSAPKEAPRSVDQRKIGRYEILGQLGAGGMGEVFLAEDATLGRKVALKVLSQKMALDAESLRRFEAEARVVAALNHPGIVTLYSLEKDADVRFMTMELIDGQTLKQLIADRRPAVTEVTTVVSDIADALGAAHARGITHRDLKPANIMQTREGRIKILDFGLARLHEDLSEEQVSDVAGAVYGTVNYMSPEQALGRPADPRSDIFSVGIVAYELATGQHPFPATSSLGRKAAVIRDTPKSVARVEPRLPTSLSRAIDRCLCKEPDHRFQTAADLGDAIRGAVVKLDSGRTGPQSVAVLPFSDLSEKRNQDDFCAGIADELIDALTRFEGLRVTSRSSTVRFKNQAEDVRRIGELLSVEAVLEGSLRLAGDRMRVAVQFTSAEDGYLLWTGKFDRVLDNPFAVQTDIAHRVVTALESQLRGEAGG